MKRILTLVVLVISCAKVIKNLKIKNKDINDDLILAINNNEKDKVIKLITQGANINSVYNGRTILELTVAKENLDIIKILIEAGVELNKNDVMKIYDLALDNSNYELIDIIKDKYELEEGLIDNNKYFLLLCYMSNAEKVKNFIKTHNIDLKEVKDKSDRSALIIACIGGNIDVVDLLIKDHKMNINYRNEYHFTPLMIALINNCIEVAKLLIEKEANINIKSTTGDTALMISSENGHIEIVELLLGKGADINEKNINNYTALILASEKGHTEVVNLLIERGASINDKTKIKSPWIVSILLPAIKDISGNTALIAASENGYIEIVKLLLEKGANINIKNENGDNALMLASSNGHKEVVKLLIDRGANINDKNNKNFTALVLASKKGHKEVVKLLIERAIDFSDVIGGSANVIKYIFTGDLKEITLEGNIIEHILIENIKGNNVENSLLIIYKYKNHINFKFKDKEGNTFLHYAALSNNLPLFIAIFQKCKNLNLTNIKGENLLYYALSKEDFNQDFIWYLINQGALLKPCSYIKDKLLLDILLPYDGLCNKLVYEPLIIKLLGNTNLNFKDKNKIKEIIKTLKIKDDDCNDKDKEIMLKFIQNIFDINYNDNLSICDISTLAIKDDMRDVELNIDVFISVLSNFTNEDFEESIRNEGLDNTRKRFLDRLNDIKSSIPIPQLDKPIKSNNPSDDELETYRIELNKYNLACIKFVTKKQLYKLGLLISQASEKDKSNIKWAINIILEQLVCHVGTLDAINYAIKCLMQQDDNNDLRDALSNEIMQFRINLIEEVARKNLHNKIACVSELGRNIAEYSNHMKAYLAMDLSKELKVIGLYENEFRYEYDKNFVINEVKKLYKERLIQEVVKLIRSDAKLSNMVRDYLEKGIFKTSSYLMIKDFVHDDEYKIKEDAIKALLVHFGYLR